MQKRIITITGYPGSGKSSTAKRLAEVLGYKHFSSGDLMRSLGLERGLSIDQTNKAAEKDAAFDDTVDATIRSWGEEENAVVDTRIAFHWIPQSFKVLLKIDPKVAAERTFAQIKSEGRTGEDAASAEELYQNLLQRIESECKRYKEKYGVDYRNESNFDLVVDTEKNNLDEVVGIIEEAYKVNSSTRG